MSLSTSDLEYQRRQVESAVAEYEKKKPFVTDINGQTLPYFNDESMQNNAVERTLQPLQAVVDAAQSAADKAEAEAKRLASSVNGGVYNEWSLAELQLHAALTPVTKSELLELPFESLQKRVEFTRDHGSKVEKTILLELLPQTRRPGERHELSSMLTEIERSLVDPKKAKAVAEADKLSKAAAQLRYYAGNALAEADGSKKFGRRESDRMYVPF